MQREKSLERETERETEREKETETETERERQKERQRSGACARACVTLAAVNFFHFEFFEKMKRQKFEKWDCYFVKMFTMTKMSDFGTQVLELREVSAEVFSHGKTSHFFFSKNFGHSFVRLEILLVVWVLKLVLLDVGPKLLDALASSCL